MEPPNDSSSTCFACTTNFLLHLLSTLRDLFRGRRNPSSTVPPGENATSQEQERRPPPPPAGSNSHVGSQTTIRGAEKCSLIGWSKDVVPEASIKPMPGKAQEEVECMHHFSDDEDVCPTCLEEYHLENPKITAHCSHQFHLGCIFEWKERSDRCPVCFRVMVFEETT